MARLEDVDAIIHQVARRIVRDYPPVEFDDVRGTLLLYYVEKQSVFDAHEDEPQYLYAAFEEKAREYAHQERAERLHRTDQYFYVRNEVKHLLEHYLFDGEMRAQSTGTDLDGGERSSIPVWDGGLYQVVTHADIDLAWSRLSDSHREALRVFAQAPLLSREAGKQCVVDYRWVSRMLGLKEEASRQRVRRAIGMLMVELNRIGLRQWEGPGSRRAMSNAAAQALTRRERGHE